MADFNDFLATVEPENRDFAAQMHEFLTEQGYTQKIDTAKNGYVVSYNDTEGKVLVNFVFRKSGLVIRIYGNNISSYEDFLAALPQEMMKKVEKSPICRRLWDPTKCNSRCQMGYTFTLSDKEYRSCRFSCFMFKINDDNNPSIMDFIKKEMSYR